MVDTTSLATELHRARLEREPVATITSRVPQFTSADAYAVQASGMEARRADGETVVGGKLGFTSVAMRRAMGVDSPNYGWLTDAMLIHDRVVDLDDLIHPKVEPEVGFLLGDDLGHDAGIGDVLAATAALIPVLEIVDSRYVDFSFAAFDNIADNSSAGKVVLGDAAVSVRGIDLRLCGAVMSCDGEPRFTAAGAAALDHPAAAVAWMARAVAAGSRPLRAGDIVISGGLTQPLDLVAGATIRLDIDHIGSASFTVR